MRRVIGFAAIGVMALLGMSSVASASPSSGTEHFRLTFTSQNGPGPVFATGVFNAGGTDYQGNNKDLAVFPTGAFTIHHPGGQFSFTLNPNTCVATLTGSGNYTLGQGYGAYKGLKGSGTYTANGRLALNRKANGTCGNATTAFEQTIVASGPVSFS
jgi:hypothetical protein